MSHPNPEFANQGAVIAKELAIGDHCRFMRSDGYRREGFTVISFPEIDSIEIRYDEVVETIKIELFFLGLAEGKLGWNTGYFTVRE
jgi:hypothetical protein